jgi:hypothetical protein
LIEKKIEQAKSRKKGVWKNGDNFETPAEYKRKTKQTAAKNKAEKVGKNKAGYAAKAY